MQLIEENHLFSGYHSLPGVYDELFSSEGDFHPQVSQVGSLINQISRHKFRTNMRIANSSFKRGGVTFTVYSNKQSTEKIFPFDLIPRMITHAEWKKIDQGLKQRVAALNQFIYDVYHKQTIFRSGTLPKQLFHQLKSFDPRLCGITPPGGIYIHVAGIDLVKNESGQFLVLEDNLRTPSGVSYVLENRIIMKRLFPDVFSEAKVKPVDEYPIQLRRHLSALVSKNIMDPLAVVLTPGSFNSAYFEHCFLAKKMGCDVVKGQDLFVHKKKVYLKTTKGPKQVHVIYRRIDDNFLDPQFFRNDSMLGVDHLMEAYKAGNIVLANAVGNGVADDKGIYPYVPDMIKYYLGEEPILSQVKTFHCNKKKELNHILKNTEKFVIKQVDASGGYGLLIGATASKKEIADFKSLIKSSPEHYVAQPLVELSTCPTFNGKDFVARRVDFRPFILSGESQWVLPGGLTRVALVEGSYVVNSSQGGGSKDTWVIGE